MCSLTRILKTRSLRGSSANVGTSCPCFALDLVLLPRVRVKTSGLELGLGVRAEVKGAGLMLNQVFKILESMTRELGLWRVMIQLGFTMVGFRVSGLRLRISGFGFRV